MMDDDHARTLPESAFQALTGIAPDGWAHSLLYRLTRAGSDVLPTLETRLDPRTAPRFE